MKRWAHEKVPRPVDINAEAFILHPSQHSDTAPAAPGIGANIMRAIYEVRNPSFPDLNLEQQIEQGINDWCAEDDMGREFFGQTRDEADKARLLYNSHRPS